MGVPLNGWFSLGKIPFKWMFWGYPHFRKPPHVCLCFTFLLTMADFNVDQSPGSICRRCEKSCSFSSCLGWGVQRGLQPECHRVSPGSECFQNAPPNVPSGPVKLRTLSCTMSCSKQGGRTMKNSANLFSSCSTVVSSPRIGSAKTCPDLPVSVQVRLHQRTPSALRARKLRVLKVTP